MFLFDACITFILSVLGYHFLPDYPHNTTWLTLSERDMAIDRMNIDHSVEGKRVSTSSKWQKIKTLLGNKYLYPFIFSWASVHISLGAAHVLGIVSKKVGFDAVTANLLTTVSFLLFTLLSCLLKKTI